MKRLAFAGLALAALSAQTPPPDPLAPEELPVSRTVPPPATDEDGVERDEQGRIVNGRPAQGAVGWQVEIYSTYYATASEAHICGGSYIGQGWIVTAAHCLPEKAAGEPVDLFKMRRVRMGTKNLTAGGATYAIERIAVHAGWIKGTGPGQGLHDIALIKVREQGQTARLGSALQAIRPQGLRETLYGREALRVTGWGWQGARDENSLRGRDRQGRLEVIPDGLREAGGLLLDRSACRADPGLASRTGPGMLCVGPDEKHADACQGDSGGPLTRALHSGEARYNGGVDRVLVGVVSTGIGCAAGHPAIYTNVAGYAEWIGRAKQVPAGIRKRVS